MDLEAQSKTRTMRVVELFCLCAPAEALEESRSELEQRLVNGQRLFKKLILGINLVKPEKHLTCLDLPSI